LWVKCSLENLTDFMDMFFLQELGLEGVEGGQRFLVFGNHILEFGNYWILAQVALALSDYSEVLVNLLHHGLDLNGLEYFFLPLFGECFKVLESLP
jgi:hypothetical protein